MANSLEIIGNIVAVQKKHRLTNMDFDRRTFLELLLRDGTVRMSEKYRDEDKSGPERIRRLKQIANDFKVAGLIVNEDANGTEREYGYHSGSHDVIAYVISIRLPLSPVIEVLYGEK